METRREILKKIAFVTPIVLTLPAVASFASAASGPNGDALEVGGQEIIISPPINP